MTTRSTATAPRRPAAYQPVQKSSSGIFVVLEGISGSGKSTLAAHLAERLGCRTFHTVPAPVSDLQPYINSHARALPQLAFYLAGALHAADLARQALHTGHAVADRYVNSVIANHAAVHGLDNATVAATIAPFTGYLTQPDITVYLHTDLDELTARMTAKPDQSAADRDLIADRALLRRLADHYDQIAAADPTAYHLHTDSRTPANLADHRTSLMHAMTHATDQAVNESQAPLTRA
ncbi:deoxynucleoside kinase [Nonomuraea sp. NPDC050404]|uniref:dTMP kinase n=1 Tax=Nonomuraea sp. NPDC050404 TaxID=3155783 RepID=UPI0033E4239B